MDWILLIKESITNIGKSEDLFRGGFNNFLCKQIKLGFGSLQTSLPCIVGKLAGGGSVAVAVGIIDR